MGNATESGAATTPTNADVDSANEHKPTVLLILGCIRGPDDTEQWKRIRSKFNIIHYEGTSIDDYCVGMQPGGRYSKIDAIVRTGWLKAGVFAEQKFFSGTPLEYLPPSLKLITCTGHGYDAADIDGLSKRGIAYANTPDSCTEPVANTALYLILNSYRYFTFAEYMTRTDRWADSREMGSIGIEPAGQVLGIVGMGDIGGVIAKKAAWGLDMKVHYFNRRRREDLEATLPASAEVRFHDTFESLLEIVDCLCLACPLVPETKHILNAGVFKKLAEKERKIRIVNIARGGLIDEDALLEAMDEGIVVGLGLDVHANEPGINPRLKDNYKTTVLPHAGVASRTSWANFDKILLYNLEEYFYGDKSKVAIVNKI